MSNLFGNPLNQDQGLPPEQRNALLKALRQMPTSSRDMSDQDRLGLLVFTMSGIDINESPTARTPKEWCDVLKFNQNQVKNLEKLLDELVKMRQVVKMDNKYKVQSEGWAPWGGYTR